MSEQRPPGPETDLGVYTDPPIAAQTRLAAGVRRLLEAAVMAEPTDENALVAAAEQAEAAADALAAHRRQGPHRRLSAPGDGLAFHLNPVLGVANPVAPPVEVEIADGEVRGRATFNDAYEGPPGYVHGGILSLVLDQTLGLANVVAGHPGMTVGLELRYRRPTPLHEPVVFTSRFSHTEGRTVHCRGAVVAGETTTVEASGVFRALTPEHGRTLFAGRLGEAEEAETRAAASEG